MVADEKLDQILTQVLQIVTEACAAQDKSWPSPAETAKALRESMDRISGRIAGLTPHHDKAIRLAETWIRALSGSASAMTNCHYCDAEVPATIYGYCSACGSPMRDDGVPHPTYLRPGAKAVIKKVADLVAKNEDPPLPLSVIPNYMGINLCSVDSVSWVEQADEQLISLTIHFIPE